MPATGRAVLIPIETLEHWANDLALHGVGDIEAARAIDALLSTASELLDALEWALGYVDESISRDLSDGAVGMGEDMDKRDRAKALIAKARGLTQ